MTTDRLQLGTTAKSLENSRAEIGVGSVFGVLNEPTPIILIFDEVQCGPFTGSHPAQNWCGVVRVPTGPATFLSPRLAWFRRCGDDHFGDEHRFEKMLSAI